MLIIGDSVTDALHKPSVEFATNLRVTSAKTGTFSTSETSKKNVAEFINNELEKDNHDVLLIQSGAREISNLPNNCYPDGIQTFTEKISNLAKEVLEVANEAACKYPNLKKIIVAKQIPRYDSSTANPPGLKTYLSYQYNNTLEQLAIDSTFNEKVVVGSHNLEYKGAIREARYKETRSGRYNGVHNLDHLGKRRIRLVY